MSEEETAVYLVLLVSIFVVYGVTALEHLPTAVGGRDRLPPILTELPAAFGWKGTPHRGRALASYLAWTAVTQFSPVAIALAEWLRPAGIASIAELAAASGWTLYLVLVLRTSRRGTD